jgi:hypothetical protein
VEVAHRHLEYERLNDGGLSFARMLHLSAMKPRECEFQVMYGPPAYRKRICFACA